MRVFVTGATGFIGSAVVRELLRSGHEVLGLARSDSSAAALTAAGAQVHRGDLVDLDSLSAGAAASDGVIHLAFDHAFTDFAGAGAKDLSAVRTLAGALEGTGRPLVITSGTLLLAGIAPGRTGTEDIVAPPGTEIPRLASEAAALEWARRGVRTSVVRLSPSVHGDGDKGFLPALINAAREKGVATYVGEGENRWPGVHRLDAARLFRLAVESAPTGSVLHGTGEEGVPMREIMGAVGRRLNLPVRSVTAEEAKEGGYFSFLADFVQLDNPTSSALTRKLLGWHPEGPTLLQDLADGHYFDHLDA